MVSPAHLSIGCTPQCFGCCCEVSLSAVGLSFHILSKGCQGLCLAETAHNIEERPSQEKESFLKSLKASSGYGCRSVEPRTQLSATQAEDVR